MQLLPETVRLESGKGGLRRLVVTTPHADAEIYLHGAHVTHFQPHGQTPLLFMSASSAFEAGKPIRGGVPICFPWFGARRDGSGPGPSHGFARLREWEFLGAEPEGNETVEIGFRLSSRQAAPLEWDGDFEVEYRVKIGSALHLGLHVRNPSDRPIRIEEALHTYLAVSNVREVSIDGLADATYLNTVGTPRTETEGTAPIRIASETDRIYLNTQSTCVVHDPVLKRRLVIEKTGSDSTVLWNPWIAKAKAMPDFGDDEWPAMLCIETCNVGEYALTLPPGRSHTLQAVIRAEVESHT